MEKYSLEPVVEVLSFVKRSKRHNPCFWIHLGFITSIGRVNPHATKTEMSMPSGENSRIYHAQMRQIYAQIHEHGSKARMRARICGKTEIRNFVLPLLLIMGDGQGSDTICGRYNAYAKKPKRIAWKCDCGPAECWTYGPHKTEEEREKAACTFLDAVEMENMCRSYHQASDRKSKKSVDSITLTGNG